MKIHPHWRTKTICMHLRILNIFYNTFSVKYPMTHRLMHIKHTCNAYSQNWNNKNTKKKNENEKTILKSHYADTEFTYSLICYNTIFILNCF